MGLSPAINVPGAQEFLQLLGQCLVLLCPLGLLLQPLESGGDLVNEVVAPEDVVPGLLQLVDGLRALGLVDADAGRLLEDGAALIGPQRQDGIHQPLADDVVGLVAQAALTQKLGDIL